MTNLTPSKEDIENILSILLDEDALKIREMLEKSSWQITPEIDSEVEKALKRLEESLEKDLKESEALGKDLEDLKASAKEYKENIKPLLELELQDEKEDVSEFSGILDEVAESEKQDEESAKMEEIRKNLDQSK